MTSLNLIIWQRLIKASDGRGRVALREYLVFDRAVRDRFLSVPVLEWVGVVNQIFSDSCSNPNLIARTMTQSAERLVQARKVRAEDVSGFRSAGIELLGQLRL